MFTSTYSAPRRFRGFTLIELMVGIGVLGILLAVGIPGFSSMIRNNRLATGSTALIGALNFARSEAIKRGEPVTACASTDGATCAGNTEWEKGWIVYLDNVGTNGTFDLGDVLLQAWPAVEGGLTLTGSRNFIQYTSNGMPNPIPSASTPETFNLKKPGCSGNYAREVSVTITGRVTSAVKSCT